MAARTSGRSVYGLRVGGLDDVRELAASDADPAPWEIPVVMRQIDAPPPAPMPLDTRRGVHVLADGRHLSLDRRRGTADLFGAPLTPDLLAHPYLGPVATVFNRWAGRESFHGGAFTMDGQAWILLGPRTAGKSSLLAALADRLVPILSDDVVVVDSETAYAGPRCIDLRDALPDLLLPGVASRGGTRLRVMLPPIAPRVPLGGWLFLYWGSTLELAPIAPSDLMARLASCRSWHQLPSDPVTILALASLPGWKLTRPYDWNLLDPTIALLCTELRGRDGPWRPATDRCQPTREAG